MSVGRGGLDPWDQLRKTVHAGERWEASRATSRTHALDSHEANKGDQDGVGRARRSAELFRLEVFLGDVLAVIDILAKKLGFRTIVTERSELRNLVKWDPKPEEILADLMKLVLSNRAIDLKEFSSVELKRISDNLSKLIQTGAKKMLNDAINDKPKAFERELYSSMKLKLRTIKSAVEKELKERVGYIAEEVAEPGFDGQILQKSVLSDAKTMIGLVGLKDFSPKFNKALFDVYSDKNLLTDEQKAAKEVGGKNVGICNFSWNDLDRFNIELEDENGSRPLYDRTVEPYPSDKEEQIAWKQKQIAKLLEFCGGNEEQLMKLSQMYLNQSIGNGHAELVEGTLMGPNGDLVSLGLTNQKLVEGEREGHAFSIPRDPKYADRKEYIKIKKKGGMISGIEYRVEAKVSAIKDTTEKVSIPVDKEKSTYFLSIKLALDKKLELVSSNSISGVVGYGIPYYGGPEDL